VQIHTPSNFNATAMLRGFTLVEVLMAVLVLAIALTGMMRMHLTALRAQRQSSYQIQRDATSRRHSRDDPRLARAQ
jgi:prepilin-type N-terminal cleavage/methylation domain-containing protein